MNQLRNLIANAAADVESATLMPCNLKGLRIMIPSRKEIPLSRRFSTMGGYCPQHNALVIPDKVFQRPWYEGPYQVAAHELAHRGQDTSFPELFDEATERMSQPRWYRNPESLAFHNLFEGHAYSAEDLCSVSKNVQGFKLSKLDETILKIISPTFRRVLPFIKHSRSQLTALYSECGPEAVLDLYDLPTKDLVRLFGPDSIRKPVDLPSLFMKGEAA